jgi:hypothetical protein
MNKSRAGQVLVESMVAVSILVVGFLGMFSLLSRSLSLNRLVADSQTATYLAAEGIEVARNLVDANVIQGKAWKAGGFAVPGAYEVEYNSLFLMPDEGRTFFFNPSTMHYSYLGGNPTSFKRKIVISPSGPNEITVNSVVTWVTLGGGSFQLNLEDHFMNWHT